MPGRVLLSECFACFALGSGAACWVLVPLQGAASMCCCHSAVSVWLVPLQGATGGCCCQSAVRARKRNCVLPTYLLLSGAYAGIISKVFSPNNVSTLRASTVGLGVKAGGTSGCSICLAAFFCKFSHKVALVRCPCAFRLRKFAQNVGVSSGAQHFACKFWRNVALVTCPCVV